MDPKGGGKLGKDTIVVESERSIHSNVLKNIHGSRIHIHGHWGVCASRRWKVTIQRNTRRRRNLAERVRAREGGSRSNLGE